MICARSTVRTLLATVLLCCCSLAPAGDAVYEGRTDPYAAWSQGRPGESLDLLVGRARATDRWDAWYDAGLAAAAAGDRGHAVSWLVAAFRRNPAADQPRAALRQLDTGLPATWVERSGPLGIPGQGWFGVFLLGGAGLVLGYGLARGKRRVVLVVGGAILAVAAAPGVVAVFRDAGEPWAAVTHDTQALDSAGQPVRPLPAGTLVRREPTASWSGRQAVKLLDGQVVLVAEGDLE